MQENNATGGNQNEQGQAAFTTGSTTGAGSDFGQGSHQLGAESYRQGSTTNAGANYGNEAGRFSENAIGISDEGAAAIAAANNQSGLSQSSGGTTARDSDTNLSSREDRGQDKEDRHVPREGERRNTDLEESSHLDTDNTTRSRREQSGSWSNSSLETDRE